MDTTRLLSPKPPHLHLLVASPNRAQDVAWSLARSTDRRVVVRTIRGAKAVTEGELFNELAAALQFPFYFGENWNAIDECLSDLEWLSGDAYVLFFTDSPQLLAQDPPSRLGLLWQVLESVAVESAHPRHEGAARAARPFHVVFQCTQEEETSMQTRLQAIGHSLPRFD